MKQNEDLDERSENFHFQAHNINESLRHVLGPYSIWNFVKKFTQSIKDRELE